jgi:hypothetical protein
MLQDVLSTLERGANLRFSEGSGDLESKGTGWLVNLTADMPTPRANLMVTEVESHGTLSPVRVGSVITVSAGEVEPVA